MSTKLESTIAEKFQRLVEINEQVSKASETGDEARSLSKRLTTASVMLNDKATLIAETLGTVTEDEVYALANKVSGWAKEIGPQEATTQWKNEDVQADIKGLLVLSEMGGILTDDQVQILKGISENLLKSGNRAPRKPAPTIEGAPDRVVIQNAEGEELGNLSGNTAQAPGNIAAKLGSIFGIEDKKSDAYALARVIAKSACKGEEVTMGEGANAVTLYPIFETEDDEA